MKKNSFPGNVEILIVGPNPAWQKTLVFRRLVKGEVNRAIERQEAAGGKGIHTLSACRRLTQHSLLFQFAGGDAGRRLTEDLQQRQLSHLTVSIEDETRICNTLLDLEDNSMTELIEPSPQVAEKEIRQARQKLASLLPSVSVLTLCGTMPRGINTTFYSKLIENCRQHAWIVVDSYRELGPVLQQAPHMLKINRRELTSMTGDNNPDEAAKSLFQQFSILWIAVTAGENNASFYSRNNKWIYTLPKIEQVINPIGAGDTATGILAAELSELNLSPASCTSYSSKNYNCLSAALATSFRRALAAASASCLNTRPAAFDFEKAAEIQAQITMKN